MKISRILLLGLIVFGLNTSCTSQSKEKENGIQKGNENIEVVYFHFTRRCATCNAVENETQNLLKKNYAKQIEEGKITFISVNLDEESSTEISERIGISEQALMIVQGEQKVDLTNVGFMFARSNPEKLHQKIQESIDKML